MEKADILSCFVSTHSPVVTTTQVASAKNRKLCIQVVEMLPSLEDAVRIMRFQGDGKPTDPCVCLHMVFVCGHVYVVNAPAHVHVEAKGQLQASSLLSSTFLFLHETGSLYAALAGLELTMETRLALNTQKSPCLCFPNSEIKGVFHHTRLYLLGRGVSH